MIATDNIPSTEVEWSPRPGELIQLETGSGWSPPYRAVSAADERGLVLVELPDGHEAWFAVAMMRRREP